MIAKIQKVQKSEGGWYSVIALVNAILSILSSEKSQSQFAFMWKVSQFTFTILPWSYLNSPTSTGSDGIFLS